MKKIILLMTALIVGYGIYNFLQPPKSPRESSKITFNAKEFLIEYGRPYKKNRLIFGEKKDGALVPFNEYWRTGANYSTDLTVSDDFIFGDVSVSKGSYWLHTIPNSNNWQIFLNSEAGTFSYFNPDETKNIAEISVNTFDLENEIEQLTIDFSEEDTSLFLRIRWDKTGLLIPIK